MAGIQSLTLAACVAGAAYLTGFAYAADMPAKAPLYKTAPTVASPWTGFYGGLNAGYGWGNASTRLVPNDAAFGAVGTFLPTSVSTRPAGFIAGGQLGYNYQIGSVVTGIEADISYSGLKKQETSTGDFFIGGILNTAAETKLEWFGTIRGRLGYLPANNLLLYITGGLAYGEVKTTTTVFNSLGCDTRTFCTSGSTSGVSIGWTVGGGLEYALSQQMSLKAEYLYLDFGDRSVTFVDPNNSNPNFVGSAFTSTTSFHANVARLGLNYRF